MNDAISPTAPTPDSRVFAPTRAMRGFYGAALCVVLLDQGTKAWLRATLPVGESAPFLPGWVHWTHVHNLGAAWNAFSGQRWLLIAVAIGVIAFVASVSRDVAKRGMMSACALGLILGGALGNLLDRISQGYVTDFIDLDTPIALLRTFPVWNVADAALTVGAGLMLLSLFNRRGAEAQRRFGERS